MSANSSLVILCATWLIACGGPGVTPRQASDVLRPACADAQWWDGTACQPRGDREQSIEQAAAALDSFRVEEALALLDRARAAGPHRHAAHIRVYEQLGIAYAYLGEEAQALDAFDMLLSLHPSHLLSYTLSPKATFIFERARQQSSEQPRPAIDVTWPRELDVTRPVPIDVEVVADPKSFLKRAQLHVRRASEANFSTLDLRLPEPGTYRRVVLPAPGTNRPEVLQIYLTAHDADGNEVLMWAQRDRPRDIPLGFEPPVPWYRKWWVWATIGGVVAVGTGTAVYALSREPPDTVDGSIELP